MTLDPNPLLSQDAKVTQPHPTLADRMINYLIIFALLLVLETIWQAVIKPHYFPTTTRQLQQNINTSTIGPGIIPRIVVHSPDNQYQYQAVLQQRQNSNSNSNGGGGGGGLRVEGGEKYFISEEDMRVITANTLMAMEEGRVKVERGGWD
ncbi:hypothetical protein AA313_de0200173 [Arthrobotrys entomopaga]|nr:hypothetical protein AA313_de0200173 [Arthrobotrys entomopaga]